MLSVRGLRVAGRHSDLVTPTTFEARAGQLTLVQGNGQEQRTALALAASGRLAPTSGSAVWGTSTGRARRDLTALRRASALVDAPGINEAELHLSVRDLVAEDLALLPRRHRGATDPSAWLTVHAFEDVADDWARDLPARRRVELLTGLALASPAVRLLVVDTPDRHSDRIEDWLPGLEALASNPGRKLAVLAAVRAVPEGWEGASAVVGDAVPAERADGDGPRGDLAPTRDDLGTTRGDLAPTRGDLGERMEARA
jgi:type II secretory pathway component PulM